MTQLKVDILLDQVAGPILCMCRANEKWFDSVTPSLIGYGHTQNDIRGSRQNKRVKED